MTPKRMAKIHKASFTHPRPWSEAEFTDFSNSPLCHFAIGQHGFALIRKAGPEAELLTIAVDPNARRKGEGTGLLRDVITHAKALGCEEIFLEVVEDNTPAIQLYKSAGFQELNYRKDYYSGPNGQRSAALVMHKSF